jgi:hypothetical protein
MTGLARWATVQVGRQGRTVAEVARELGCDWHTVNDAVMAYGTARLAADVDRVGQVGALGLDETLFARVGRWRQDIGKLRGWSAWPDVRSDGRSSCGHGRGVGAAAIDVGSCCAHRRLTSRVPRRWMGHEAGVSSRCRLVSPRRMYVGA